MDPERTKEGSSKEVTFELYLKGEEKEGAVFHEGRKAGKGMLGLVCSDLFFEAFL